MIMLSVLISSCSRNSSAVFNTLVEWENYEKALEVAEKMVRKSPDDINALNSKAKALLYLAREDEAISILDKILTLAPDDNEALASRAHSLYLLDRYDEALEYIQKALSQDPNNKLEYIYHGNILISFDRYDEARTSYLKALDMDSSDVNAIYGLGSACYWMGDYSQSIEQFLIYLKARPDDTDAIAYLGYSYLNSGDIQLAENEVIRLKSFIREENNEYMNKLRYSVYKLEAECLSTNGKYEETLNLLKDAEKINTDDEDLYRLFGETHYALGNLSHPFRLITGFRA